MLWTHQQEAIAWADGRRDVLLWIGMGAGKTRTTLEIIKRMMLAGSIRRILVGCPKAVIPAWAKQAGMWLPEIRVLLLDRGTSADKGRMLMAAMADTSPVIVVGNYESLWRIKEVEKLSWDCLVWDEVHRLKSPSGAASKWAAKMCKKNPTSKRIGLSGTLLSQSPLDAFGTWRAVESPECPTWGPFYGLFKATFAITNPAIPGMVIGWRNKEQFAARVAATTFQRKSEDVLDLPPIHHIEVPVEMTAKEGRVYTQLEKEFCAEVDGGFITPQNAMVGLLRMLQATSGFMRLDDTVAARQIDETPSKRAAFAEMLEDMPENEPLVVFCRFRSDIDSVLHACEQLGRTVSELSGKVDDLAAWQAGETAVLVAQIQSGGIGIDLTRAAVGIFYSLGHSLSEWLQAIARLHRPGQERNTRFFSLVAQLHGKTTADGRVYEALSNRKEVIDVVCNSYRARQCAVDRT
jgi:superfamily II DNA or RNA helicase